MRRVRLLALNNFGLSAMLVLAASCADGGNRGDLTSFVPGPIFEVTTPSSPNGGSLVGNNPVPGAAGTPSNFPAPNLGSPTSPANPAVTPPNIGLPATSPTTAPVNPPFQVNGLPRTIAPCEVRTFDVALRDAPVGGSVIIDVSSLRPDIASVVSLDSPNPNQIVFPAGSNQARRIRLTGADTLGSTIIRLSRNSGTTATNSQFPQPFTIDLPITLATDATIQLSPSPTGLLTPFINALTGIPTTFSVTPSRPPLGQPLVLQVSTTNPAVANFGALPGVPTQTLTFAVGNNNPQSVTVNPLATGNTIVTVSRVSGTCNYPVGVPASVSGLVSVQPVIEANLQANPSPANLVAATTQLPILISPSAAPINGGFTATVTSSAGLGAATVIPATLTFAQGSLAPQTLILQRNAQNAATVGFITIEIANSTAPNFPDGKQLIIPVNISAL